MPDNKMSTQNLFAHQLIALRQEAITRGWLETAHFLDVAKLCLKSDGQRTMGLDIHEETLSSNN